MSLRAKRGNLGYLLMKAYVYILTNARRSTLYVGVTTNIQRRVHQHKEKLVPGFTQRYKVDQLVYYELFESILDAIRREKQLKAGSRRKKLELIEAVNSVYRDLYYDL